MPKSRTVKVKQELVEMAKRTVETGRYRSLSEFVSEAIRLRLLELEQSHGKIVEKRIEYPLVRERLLFTSDHMWAMATPEGNVRVGLSHYAQRHLKGISGIKTDPVGCEVKKGKPFGIVETWMFIFDLYSPVSGKIIKINNVVQDEPSVINRDPYETAWVAEIAPDNPIALGEELRDLMRENQYKTLVSKIAPRILGA